jgi:NAD(P)-dependent dehydrogenase (short-subunit alcohol dehydrogenase family)
MNLKPTMHMSQGEEVAVVTGSSTGIGFETPLTLARNGFHTTVHSLSVLSGECFKNEY